MLTTTDKKFNPYFSWLEKARLDNYFKYYNYKNFTNRKQISCSSNGTVSRANWNDSDVIMVLKQPFNLNIHEIVNEIKMHREVDYHPNIIKFYGISILEKKHLLVMEYADGGSLQSYLKENFINLEWCDKYQLAFQLASGVACMHNEGIIHGDLHALNVLVHQKNIKIADFGLSRKLTDATIYSTDVFGVVPYVDPKYFNNVENKNKSRHYYLNLKSDVYSMGVLFWQISSGHKPFENDGYDAHLIIKIKEGRRENIIRDTPIEYSCLYKKCWEEDPSKRPSMKQVVESLNTIIFKENNNVIHSVNCIESKLEMLEDTNSLSSETDSELYISKLIHNLQDYHSESMNNECDSHIISQAKILFFEIYDIADSISILIDKLIALLIQTHDEGNDFNESKHFINQCIFLSNKYSHDIFDWLKGNENQMESKYLFFLGFFYYNFKNDKTKAFDLFLKVSTNNYPIAQVYLSLCYKEGFGIKSNNNLAYNWIQKAVKNGSIFGQFNLGVYYENIEKDFDKAIYWYQTSTSNGNLSGLYNLGRCYELGKGIKKCANKALDIYKELSEKEVMSGKYRLGICYYFGIGTHINKVKAFNICKYLAENGYQKSHVFFGHLYYNGEGTEKDLEKSFYWYQKAAENGYGFAQYNLGHLFEKGLGTMKDLKMAFYWYQKAAENGYGFAQNNLGYLYERGIGIIKNLEMAFFWYQKAAENGHGLSQKNLAILYYKGEGIVKNFEKAFYWYQKAAESGNVLAWCNLAICYEKGEGIEKDLEKAFYWYQKAANSGNFVSMFNLALCYEKGEGTKKDLEKAFYWHHKAAVCGIKVAMFNLAICYEKGEGTEKDLEKAFYWHHKAAKLGIKVAMYNSAICYEQGAGVEKNFEKAFYWYQKAAENNYIKAQNRLGYLYKKGKGIERNLETSFYWHKQSAENGLVSAQYSLGRYYEKGMGTIKNLEMTFYWYQKAAENSDMHAQAQAKFARLYEQGLGTRKCIEYAIYWYEKAKRNGNQKVEKRLNNLVKQQKRIKIKNKMKILLS